MTNKPPDSSDTDINWHSSEVAERRNRGRARRGEIQGPATQMMLDLADVRSGSRVLDVVAGREIKLSWQLSELRRPAMY